MQTAIYPNKGERQKMGRLVLKRPFPVICGGVGDVCLTTKTRKGYNIHRRRHCLEIDLIFTFYDNSRVRKINN